MKSSTPQHKIKAQSCQSEQSTSYLISIEKVKMAEELLEPGKDLDQEQRHSQLPEDLQRLVDEEERYRFASGDFENSWTST